MSEREQYGKLGDELEDRADALADENRRLGERIAVVRADSERTRAESGVTPDWDDPDEDEDEDEEEDGEHNDEDDDGSGDEEQDDDPRRSH
ncbi:MAG: hypothetical protein WAU75_05300 [Solirubrobacteraceae bacterium]